MKLFFRKFGEGEPVIILHGIFGISDNWVTIGRKLGEKFTVYIPDQRNHGNSPHSPAFNYYALVDDLLEFIEEHELEEPVLIGHSMGGKVAMSFALDTGIKINKLVVVDISPGAYTPKQIHIEIIRAMQSVDFDAARKRQDVNKMLSEYIDSPRIRQFIMKNLYRISSERFGWRLNLNALSANLEEISGAIESDNNFPDPVLFVKGGNSDYIKNEDEEYIYKLFPNAMIRTIEGATHWVHADKGDELCRLLSEFLEKECDYRSPAGVQ